MKTLAALIFLTTIRLYSADLGFADREVKYRLQASDQLELSYRYTPEYNQTMEIQPDGYATVKLAGSVKLSGLTLQEARMLLLNALGTRLNDPEIALTLKEFVRPFYVVAGQVATPGKYDLHGDVTTVAAIAIAGGFKDSALHSQVILFRRVNAEMAQTRIIDLKRFTNPSHPHLDEDIKLLPGDLLVIPKNTVSKIADYVHWVSVGSYIPM